ncbi:hypothetical protein BDN70DRAFT_939709 [Pholiota conissans]|uniref:Uncharacterized protein n=1 Tax=Pholiota conissans TaxID=109636 RepID=A0A9P6CQR1_9AGAR|nr:hypothetical protein BDN70DRAFT_939709 [Pholiota conissans]
MGHNRKKNKRKGKTNRRKNSGRDVQSQTDDATLHDQPLASRSEGRISAPSSDNRRVIDEILWYIAITGGNFEQTNGHRNSVNIQLHVHNFPRDQDLRTSEPEPPPPTSSPPSQACLFSSTPPTDGRSSRWTSPFADVNTRRSSDADEKNSNEIYEEQLLRKKRGFPLFNPGPNLYRPLSYLHVGVSIGDVGIFTQSGGFSFIFSICLARNDPIQPKDLPEDFAPIEPCINTRELRRCPEFLPGSHLASKSIKKVLNDNSSDADLTFEAIESEGAILTLPEGAIAYDLENKSRIEKYAAENVERWYRYINGTCGRQAKNGDVRLVIGCDKSTSWGMAVINSPDQHTIHCLKYRLIVSDASPSSSSSSSSSSIPSNQHYRWDSSGYTDTRIGPHPEEIELLRQNEDSTATTSEKHSNQCLFARTLNLTLRDNVFVSINEELNLVLNEERSSCITTSHVSTNSASSGLNESRSGGADQSSRVTNIGTQRLPSVNMVDNRVTISTSPKAAQKVHPADLLNQMMLDKASLLAPGCRVAITIDEHWCSVINEDDKNMPNAVQIAERVFDSYDIVEDNGTSSTIHDDFILNSDRRCRISSA